MKWKDLVPWKSESSKAIGKYEDHPYAAFQREMNKLFDNFFSRPLPFTGSEAMPFKGWEGFSPSVNVEENDKEFVVKAELPGMNENDIDIKLTNDHLVLRGEKKNEWERKEDDGVRYVESSFGRFERIIPLGFEIDEDNLDAKLKSGVLTIRLPKSHEAQREAKKISIRAE